MKRMWTPGQTETVVDSAFSTKAIREYFQRGCVATNQLPAGLTCSLNRAHDQVLVDAMVHNLQLDHSRVFYSEPAHAMITVYCARGKDEKNHNVIRWSNAYGPRTPRTTAADVMTTPAPQFSREEAQAFFKFAECRPGLALRMAKRELAEIGAVESVLPDDNPYEVVPLPLSSSIRAFPLTLARHGSLLDGIWSSQKSLRDRMTMPSALICTSPMSDTGR